MANVVNFCEFSIYFHLPSHTFVIIFFLFSHSRRIRQFCSNFYERQLKLFPYWGMENWRTISTKWSQFTLFSLSCFHLQKKFLFFIDDKQHKLLVALHDSKRIYISRKTFNIFHIAAVVCGIYSEVFMYDEIRFFLMEFFFHLIISSESQ